MTASVACGVTTADKLVTLRELTLRIRDLLLIQDWATAAELDLTRRAGIAELFERKPSNEELPLVVNGLRELVAMNDELLGLMAHQRRGLDRRTDMMVAAKRVGKAYLGGAGRR